MWLSNQRDAARRQNCQANVKAMGLAVHDYRVARGRFPQYPNNNLVAYLATEDPNLKGRLPRLGSLRCPSDDLAFVKSYTFSYAWNSGSGFAGGGKGFLPADLGQPFTLSDFPDGISHTAAASETLVFDIDSPETRRKLWVVSHKYPRNDEQCYRIEDRPHFQHNCHHVLMDDDHMSYSNRGTDCCNDIRYCHLMAPNQPSCEISPGGGEFFAANSSHAGGVYLLLVDGSVRFISNEIDTNIWTALATRDGQEVVDW